MAYHNHLSQDLPLQHFTDQSQQQQQQQDPHTLRTSLPDQQQRLQAAPNWLNNALLRTQQPQYDDNTNNSHNNNNNNNSSNFLNLHTASDSTAVSQSSNQWLSRPILHRNHSDVIDDVSAAAGDSMIAAAMSHESAENLKNSAGDSLNPNKSEVGVVVESGSEGVMNWQNARYKAEILAHPLYDQLLSAHVACLRIATPVDQLPRIDAQLAQSQNVVAKYSALGHGAQGMVGDDKELEQFLVCLLLSSLCCCRFVVRNSLISVVDCM